MMSPAITPLPTEMARLKAGWAKFLHDFPASYDLFAVTLAFNNRIQGTVLPSRSLASRQSGGSRKMTGPYRLGGYRLIPAEDVTRTLNRVWLKTNKRLWGDRYVRARKPVCHYKGFIENPCDNVHLHLAWAVPPTQPREGLAETLDALWRDAVPSGSTQIEPMVSPSGWGEYLVKKVFSRDWSDRSGKMPRPTDAAENFLSSLPTP